MSWLEAALRCLDATSSLLLLRPIEDTMSDRRPYSRIYWTVMDDPKFDLIRADMRHFGSWTLLLIVADMAYPAPAFIPPTVPKASIKALVDAGLVDLVTAGMFRVRGLTKERERRSEPARENAAARWAQSNGNAPALRPQSGRNARRDETSKDETRHSQDEDSAREVGPSEDEGQVFAAIAQAGAYLRPESGLGQRVIGLVTRQGAAVVLGELAALIAAAGRPLSDRQIVFGLEAGLEEIPSGREVMVPEATGPTHGDRIFSRMEKRRLEYYRESGLWPDEWGPRPEGAAA